MQEFLQRLKQRKLVQWAIAYVAFAFALLQGVDVVAQQFGWPDELRRGITLALALGFFVALVLAWYHGERGAQKLTGTELLILTLLLAIGGGLLWRYARTPHSVGTIATSNAILPASSLASIPAQSIAVLPLANESGAAEEQYFSDGLSEDLITALSQFGGLKVISRNSSFQFRNTGDDSKTIGEKLGVAHLLEGSVRRAGDMVRISAELVNAADGSTLWSQRYDRPYKDLFALQDEITSAVATALKAKLLEGSAAMAQSERPPSGNLDAWNAYSRGRFYSALLSPEDARKEIGFYEQAIALDPHYARAYAAMADAWITLGSTYLARKEQPEAYARARSAADQAYRLNPDMAAAHEARGVILEIVDLDYTGAEIEYRRSVELAPNDDSVSSLGTLLGALGRPRQALTLIRRGIELDPRNGGKYYWLAWNLVATGQLDEAEQAARKAVALAPGAFTSAGLVIVQVVRGETRPALATAQQTPKDGWRDFALALAMQPGLDRAAADHALKTLIENEAESMSYQIAEVYGLRKDPDNMFAWLDHAWDNRDSGIHRLLTDPFILPYRDDPRFAAFCRKAGLPIPDASYGSADAG